MVFFNSIHDAISSPRHNTVDFLTQLKLNLTLKKSCCCAITDGRERERKVPMQFAAVNWSLLVALFKRRDSEHTASESKVSKLFSLEDFFRHTQSQGRRFFGRDGNGDGQVTIIEDVQLQLPAGSLLKSALAGGISCAFSTAVMHPVDTIKTQVQASALLSFPQIISKLPEIGLQGLYRGSIPAILGQFTSHGLRTAIFEASKVVLINVAPTLPDIQVQSVASFCATVLGTTMRIPCEVLKQRCQAGLFDNVGEALVATWQQDGLKGFFRGTVFTLFREVPFYVAGMGLYAESKKLARHLLGRELQPWETITIGALSGGLAAVTTTPFDVMKTRMMTAPQGQPMAMQMVAFSILRHEGPLGLFKGGVPRFFWIAPLGAMNFAGYELLRKAMDGQNRNS